jgi:hypothetical protein
MSILIIIILPISGYIYQSGENKKIQDLQYKRETYANLMENLLLFKKSGEKTNEEINNLSKIYFRSWAETSDEINEKLLEYFKAYKKWSEDKTTENEKLEKEKFNNLTDQIKIEINSKSNKKFEPYYFQIKP